MKFFHRLLIALFDLIRPFLGFMNMVCIYPLSCSDYAKQQIVEKKFFTAFFLISLRVLSCNPINAYFNRMR